MPVPDIVAVQQLSRLFGLSDSPALTDVGADEGLTADPRFLRNAARLPHHGVVGG